MEPEQEPSNLQMVFNQIPIPIKEVEDPQQNQNTPEIIYSNESTLEGVNDNRKPIQYGQSRQTHHLTQGYLRAEFLADNGNAAGVMHSTGTLITDKLVLTAAHCVYNYTLKKPEATFSTTFQVGLYDHKAKDIAKIKKIFIPEQYKNSVGDIDPIVRAHDYAILELDRPILLNTIRVGLQPMKFSQVPPKIGDKVCLYGYPVDRNIKEFAALNMNGEKRIWTSFGAEGIIYSIDGPFIKYKITTSVGQSGCPILRKDSNGIYEIIGIHKGNEGKIVNYGISVLSMEQYLRNWVKIQIKTQALPKRKSIEQDLNTYEKERSQNILNFCSTLDSKNYTLSGVGVKLIFQYTVFGDKYKGNCKAQLRDGKGIYTYLNGDIYDGEWFENQRQGFGIFTKQNGEVFKGNWQHDEMQKGTYEFPDGSIYTGSFLDNMMHDSQAKFLLKNGDYFHGKYEQGVRGGKDKLDGVYTYTNGNQYVGEWKNNQKHGYGQMKYSHNDFYRGSWEHDQKHGDKGIYIYSDGKKYEGQWKNDSQSGKGIYNFGDNHSYVGQFKNSQMHGRGTYKSLRWVYEGSWKNNEKSGEGNLTYILGNDKFNTYKGQFKHNQFQGNGTLELFNGDRYDGTWKDEQHFHGKVALANGDIYEGSCYRLKRQGKGMLIIESTAHKYDGNWINDKLPQGIIFYHNGDQYQGGILELKRHGKGKLTKKQNLQVEQGEWKNDEKQFEAIASFKKMLFGLF